MRVVLRVSSSFRTAFPACNRPTDVLPLLAVLLEQLVQGTPSICLWQSALVLKFAVSQIALVAADHGDIGDRAVRPSALDLSPRVPFALSRGGKLVVGLRPSALDVQLIDA